MPCDPHDPIEQRLRDYFLKRAIETLELATKEQEPEAKYDLEARCAGYWKLANAGD
jgi:hypothetical protein